MEASRRGAWRWDLMSLCDPDYHISMPRTEITPPWISPQTSPACPLSSVLYVPISPVAPLYCQTCTRSSSIMPPPQPTPTCPCVSEFQSLQLRPYLTPPTLPSHPLLQIPPRFLQLQQTTIRTSSSHLTSWNIPLTSNATAHFQNPSRLALRLFWH